MAPRTSVNASWPMLLLLASWVACESASSESSEDGPSGGSDDGGSSGEASGGAAARAGQGARDSGGSSGSGAPGGETGEGGESNGGAGTGGDGGSDATGGSDGGSDGGSSGASNGGASGNASGSGGAMAGSGGAKAGAGGASGAGAGGSATGGSGGGGPAPGSCAGATGIRLTGLYHPTGEVISIDIEFFSDNVAIPVNELTVRYFITQEEDSPWRDMLYYSRIFQPPDPTPKGLGFDQVWQTLTPPLAYADTYLDLRFRGSLVLRPGDTGHVHFEIHPTSWDPPNQDQLDDWSFIIASPRMPWPNIVVLRNGELVWGCMPRAL